MMYPHAAFIVDSGKDHLGEYVETRCGSSLEQTEYGARMTDAILDPVTGEPIVRQRHYKKDRDHPS